MVIALPRAAASRPRRRYQALAFLIIVQQQQYLPATSWNNAALRKARPLRKNHHHLPTSTISHHHSTILPDNGTDTSSIMFSQRRDLLQVFLAAAASIIVAPVAAGADDESGSMPVEIKPASSDVHKLFGEARALEQQGNLAAAQRLYVKVTQISPRFVYGHANLANVLTAQGQLGDAEAAYTVSIDLCQEAAASVAAAAASSQQKCPDLYLLYLNRGVVRLNSNQVQLALQDLNESNRLRARPDLLVLQNLARAQELNQQYGPAGDNYNLALQMAGNDVAPFWLRAALVQAQLGSTQTAWDLARRVETRFPEAPEVKAALATLTYLRHTDQQVQAQQKLLEIPDRARRKFADPSYVESTIAWPPKLRQALATLSKAIGDA